MPSLQVIGVYSPKANEVEYAEFVQREIESQNPINFSAETKAFLKRVGREAEIVALSEDELAERRAYFEQELSSAALVEVLVEQPDASFSVGEFIQPNPQVPEGRWQVAWCEKFLTADGEHLLGDFSFNELPTENQYRVAFYMHSWNQRLPLLSSYGPVELPPMVAMPPRLWRLVPYEQVD
ncbi:hypothetical protein [Piscinibacter koreensis]|uniref:Uncharacterized protein n=1 Tax=Piscinibacter koreensis TaxID=2742824 RepID=A0A7Y6TXE4_9BURK|nr:hypothetical protein [Schlegelella koreensis]NUZ07069.1 hypothetical protein [Schlegelella koreensis]